MSGSSFERSLARVLVYEGGKVDNPKDPGGRTNQGVTQAVFSAWLVRHGQKARDVYTMKPVERDAIYRAQYWDAISGDALPSGVDLAVFDGAVNSGPQQSAKWLQRALGNNYSGTVDGHIGIRTLEAVAAHPDHDMLIARMEQVRLDFMQHLKTWATFGRGWTTRLNDCQRAAQAIASGSVPGRPAALFSSESLYTPGKAYATDADGEPNVGLADAATGAGGATAAITQVINQLTPISYYSEGVQKVIMVLTVAGVVIALGGTAYAAYARWRKQRRVEALGFGLQ